MKWRAAAFAFVFVACGSGREEEAVAPRRPTAVPVTVSAVTKEPVIEEIVGTGTLAAHKTTDVGPRVSGIIDEIRVKVGDRVEAGDVLFHTRGDDYAIRVRQARARVRLALAESHKFERDLRRVEKLHTQGVASDSRLDEVRTGYEAAIALRESAEAQLAEAQQNLADTIVKAPYPGVITRRYVDEGSMMSTIMSANAKVVQIMKIDIVSGIVQVPEIHLSRIRVGTPARLAIDGIEGIFESEVYILNPRVDHRSRAVEVRVPIRNPDHRLKPGLFVRAELIPEPREALVVPRSSVLGTPGARHVFVEDGGVARRRDVVSRELDTRRLEVVEGLEPGEGVLGGPNLARIEDGVEIAIELAHADR